MRRTHEHFIFDLGWIVIASSFAMLALALLGVNSLGGLNDMAVHADRSHGIARSHRRSPKLLQAAYAMGFLVGSEKRKAHALERAAEKAGKSLEHADRFW